MLSHNEILDGVNEHDKALQQCRLYMLCLFPSIQTERLPLSAPQGGERDYYRKQAEHCKKRIELKRKTIAVYQEALREDQTALRWLQEDCASFIKRAEAHGQNKKITLPWDILTCIFSYLDEEDVFSFDGGDVRITGRPPVKPNWKDQLCHGKDCGLSFTSSTFPESKIKQYTTRLLETSSLTVHFNGLKLDHKQILGLLANFTDSRTIDSVVIYDSQSQQSWDRSSTSYREYCASFEKVLSRTRRLRFPGSCPSFLIKDQPESSKLNFRLAFSRLEHMSVSCRDFCLFHGYMQNLKSLDLHYKEFGDWSLKDNDNNLFCCLKSVSSLQRLRIQRVECDPYRRTTDYEMVFDCIADEQTVEFRPRNDPDELAITFPNLRELELHASDGFITGHIVRFLKCPVLEELKVYHRGNNERMSEYTYEDYHELMQTLSEAYPTIHRLALPKWPAEQRFHCLSAPDYGHGGNWLFPKVHNLEWEIDCNIDDFSQADFDVRNVVKLVQNRLRFHTSADIQTLKLVVTLTSKTDLLSPPLFPSPGEELFETEEDRKESLRELEEKTRVKMTVDRLGWAELIRRSVPNVFVSVEIPKYRQT